MWKVAAVVCLITSVLPAHAQTPSGPTFETLTGKGWVLMMTDAMKFAYVKGFQDAVAILTPDNADYLAKGFTVADYVREIDELFKARENQPLLLPLAHQYVTLKLRGQLTKAELEQRLIAMRQLMAKYQ
jgi:hypothetical protein